MSRVESLCSSTCSTETFNKLEKMNSFDDRLSPSYRIGNLPPKRIRYNSTNFLSRYPEKELLLNISKNQRRMSGCFEDKINSFEREKLFEKADKTLKNLKLSNEQKKSIFHRFCYLLGFITEKLYVKDKNICFSKINVIATAILLLSFKFEGIFIDKKFTFNIITNYLNELGEELIKEDIDEIFSYEGKIIKVLESSPEIINDNNLYQLSFFLFELFMRKYSNDIDEDKFDDIKNQIDYCNQLIEIKYNIVYNLYPIDKALISFYSSAKFVLEPYKNMIGKLDNFYSYLKANLEISKISKRDFEINCKDVITRLKHNNSGDSNEH